VLNIAIQRSDDIGDVEDLVCPSRSGMTSSSKIKEVPKSGAYLVVRQVIFSFLESMIRSSVLLHRIIKATAY
jgi:hypothetical protein